MNGNLITTATSELDVAMQPYITSGIYSADELEKIRKRLASKKDSYEFTWGEEKEEVPVQELLFSGSTPRSTAPSIPLVVGDKIEVVPNGPNTPTKSVIGPPAAGETDSTTSVSVSPEYITENLGVDPDQIDYYNFEHTDKLNNGNILITEKDGTV